MNIFELLGLPANHRSKDKVTMKVKHWSEVPESKKPKNATYYAQVKEDGIFCHVVKFSDDYHFFSRTGLELTNTDRLREYLLERGKDMPEGIYIAELCCSSCSLEALSGIFNPNRNKPLSKEQDRWCSYSYLDYHDYLSIFDFIEGKSTDPYSIRYSNLLRNLTRACYAIPADAIEYDDVEAYARHHIDWGEEGVVIKKADEIWVAGHKGHRSMKIVRGVDYDLLCIGVEEGTGKYAGKVANLIFQWKDGKTIKAMLGKGWTHVDAERMFNAFTNPRFATKEDMPIGKIFQVYALQESSKGVLRLPKVGELRFDKEKPDV